MSEQKESAKCLYDMCREFLDKHRHIYDETINVIKYMNLLESANIRIKQIDVDIYNYTQLLENKYVKESIKKTIENLTLQKMEILDDIDFYNKKIHSLNSNEEVYMKYIYCQVDIKRYEKILLS